MRRIVCFVAAMLSLSSVALAAEEKAPQVNASSATLGKDSYPEIWQRELLQAQRAFVRTFVQVDATVTGSITPKDR